MRPTYLLSAARRKPLTSRSVSLNLRQHGSTRYWYRYSSVSAPTRHSATGKASPTTWTQHRLKSPRTGIAPHSYPSPVAAQHGRKKHTAYIALGSNLGDRIGMIERACNEMSARGIRVTQTSSLWETEPMYVLDQDKFVNGACEVETMLDPIALLDELQAIENAMGREKFIDKGPRNIDLDILLYDDQVVEHERLQIPHLGILEREFVLRPLAQLIPGKALNPKTPWKVTQDYLNALPPSSPLTTLTPLRNSMEPLRPLQSNRATHMMSIQNLTPDSFSDGGKPMRFEAMFHHNQVGLSILDIGGQSSAPGAISISAEEEINRISGLIRSLNSARINATWNDFAISVDTYRASVARAAVEAGADIINDISAGQLDPEMLSTMANTGKTVCLMHMRGTPETMNSLTDYPDGLIPTVAEELLERVAAAEKAGIRRWRIILDPGIGFAKKAEHNLEILRRLGELRDWPGLQGLPWLIGSSRKNFVGKITGVDQPNQRTWGTAATVAAAIQGGADIVRVHDVPEMVQVAKMSDAIWRV